jgi:hypothetical protein
MAFFFTEAEGAERLTLSLAVLRNVLEAIYIYVSPSLILVFVSLLTREELASSFSKQS